MLATSREYQSALAEGYLNRDNYNLFTIDWSGGSEQAGKEAGEFLGVLLNVTGEKYLEFHLVGVGDGCGICRAAAEEVFRLTGRKVNRVTELDPLSFPEDGRGRGKFADVTACGSKTLNGGDVNFHVITKDEGR